MQDALRKQIRQASWVKAGNIHLTMKFLGEVEGSRLATIEGAVEQVARNHSPFTLQVGGIGAFPNLTRPRVIWAGIKVGASEVSTLTREINLELNRCGYPLDEKKFNPHLTIARIKSRVDLRPFVHMFDQYEEIDNASMIVHEITLVRSQLHPKGAIYTPLKSCKLNKEIPDG
jgi:2'-5' RNA ligase